MYATDDLAGFGGHEALDPTAGPIAGPTSRPRGDRRPRRTRRGDRGAGLPCRRAAAGDRGPQRGRAWPAGHGPRPTLDVGRAARADADQRARRGRTADTRPGVGVGPEERRPGDGRPAHAESDRAPVHDGHRVRERMPRPGRRRQPVGRKLDRYRSGRGVRGGRPRGRRARRRSRRYDATGEAPRDRHARRPQRRQLARCRRPPPATEPRARRDRPGQPPSRRRAAAAARPRIARPHRAGRRPQPGHQGRVPPRAQPARAAAAASRWP